MAIKPWGMKQRRKTSSQWQSDNDVLEDGEIGFETDTGLAKAGRSGQAWNDLDYLTDWDSGIVNKPDTFPPSEHDHDDRYMLEDDIVDDYYSKDDWNQAIIGAPWDSGRTYAQNQTVSHDGRYWVSKVDDNTVEPGTDDTKWEEFKGPYDPVPYVPPGLYVVHEADDQVKPTADAWTPTPLNKNLHNAIEGASVDVGAHRITLPAGEYFADCFQHFYYTQDSTIRLRDVTNGATLLVGQHGYTHTGSTWTAHAKGYFTLSAETEVEFQYYVEDADNNGLARDPEFIDGNPIGVSYPSAVHILQLSEYTITKDVTEEHNINFPPGILVSQYINENTLSPCGTNTWCTTEINTVDHNAISSASVDLSEHQITLPAGTYYAEIQHFFMRTTHSYARLQDVTNNITLVLASNLYADPGSDGDGILTHGRNYFTLDHEAVVKLQHYYTDSSSYEIGYHGDSVVSRPVNVAHILQINEFQITEDVTYSYNANHPPTMILEDRKSPGTDGGTNSTSRDTRDLNTVVHNDISGASLDSSTGEFTLPAGTYEVEWWSPFNFTQRTVTWLYDITHDDDIAQAVNQFFHQDDRGSGISEGISPPFELSEETKLRIDYDCEDEWTDEGLGIQQNSHNSVDHELYTRVRVRKVG